jgi:hypothetical protein
MSSVNPRFSGDSENNFEEVYDQNYFFNLDLIPMTQRVLPKENTNDVLNADNRLTPLGEPVTAVATFPAQTPYAEKVRVKRREISVHCEPVFVSNLHAYLDTVMRIAHSFGIKRTANENERRRMCGQRPIILIVTAQDILNAANEATNEYIPYDILGKISFVSSGFGLVVLFNVPNSFSGTWLNPLILFGVIPFIFGVLSTVYQYFWMNLSFKSHELDDFMEKDSKNIVYNAPRKYRKTNGADNAISILIQNEINECYEWREETKKQRSLQVSNRIITAWDIAQHLEGNQFVRIVLQRIQFGILGGSAAFTSAGFFQHSYIFFLTATCGLLIAAGMRTSGFRDFVEDVYFLIKNTFPSK